MKVMFVCTGNICRSAMAHWLLVKKLKDRNIKDVEVYSSGIYADNGDGSTWEAISVMEDYGVDLKPHRATNIRNSNIEEMDVILGMTIGHKQQMLQMYPNLKDKIFTLKEYVGYNKAGHDEINIIDPWGYNVETYRNCAEEIDECLNLFIDFKLNSK